MFLFYIEESFIRTFVFVIGAWMKEWENTDCDQWVHFTYVFQRRKRVEYLIAHFNNVSSLSRFSFEWRVKNESNGSMFTLERASPQENRFSKFNWSTLFLFFLVGQIVTHQYKPTARVFSTYFKLEIFEHRSFNQQRTVCSSKRLSDVAFENHFQLFIDSLINSFIQLDQSNNISTRSLGSTQCPSTAALCSFDDAQFNIEWYRTKLRCLFGQQQFIQP